MKYKSILPFTHIYSSSSFLIWTHSYLNIIKSKMYNVTSTLTLLFKLMTCPDNKCVYLCSKILLWTDCSKPGTSIMLKFTQCLQYVCNLFFRLTFIGLVQYWSHSLCIYQWFLSLRCTIIRTHITVSSCIYTFSAQCSHNEWTNKMMEPHLEPVPSCPILPSENTVHYHVLEHPKPKHIAHTVYCWTRIAYRSGLIRQSLTL